MTNHFNLFRSGLFLLLVSCSLLLSVSCQSGPDDTIVPEGQSTITFSVSNYRQISFDDLSGAGSTRATETISMTLANLSLTVFNAETNEVVYPTVLHESKNYDKSNAKTFPSFSVTLPYGHYQLLVLGYNGKHSCNIASLNHISWEGDYVPNTFLYCNEFTLDKNTNLNQQITLRHVVAAFCVYAEDALPATLKKMRFSTTAGGTVLDATTGYTPQITSRTSDIIVPPDSLGSPCHFYSYLFLPEEQTTGNYTVQALGVNDVLINEKHFNNVPLRINYKTEWQGKFFEASDDEDPSGEQRGFSIEWDTKWAGTLPIEP
jgi:hypothetical protein